MGPHLQQVLLVDAESGSPLGHARYVTDLSATTRPNASAHLARPKSIKGLTCILDIDDAIDLGVTYVNDNICICIQNIIDVGNEDPEAVYEWR